MLDTLPLLVGQSLEDSLEVLSDVALDALLNVIALLAYELLASYSLLKLDISLGDTSHNLWSHIRHLLTLLALEAILHQPLTNELLRELLLLLARCQTLLVALLVEVA